MATKKKIAAAAILVVLCCGGLILLWRGPFQINVFASKSPQVEVMATAEQQFLYARSQGTEAAWQSVINNFNDRLYVPQAEEELALLYLNTLDPLDREKVARLFQHMAKDYPAVDVQWRATGLAGQAIAFSLDGKAQQSEEELVALDKLLTGDWDTPQARRYLDPRMIQMLRSIAAHNNKALGDEFTKQFQKKLDTMSAEPDG